MMLLKCRAMFPSRERNVPRYSFPPFMSIFVSVIVQIFIFTAREAVDVVTGDDTVLYQAEEAKTGKWKTSRSILDRVQWCNII